MPPSSPASAGVSAAQTAQDFVAEGTHLRALRWLELDLKTPKKTIANVEVVT